MRTHIQSSSAGPVLQLHEEKFPWKHIIGYVLSLVMTALALWLALGHHMSGKPLVITILILAVLQIVVQLFLFMHLTESDGTRAHFWTIVLGFFFTFVVVAASMWIMTFGSQVS
jgi:cytochrome aa3 quinol oxidase subunit IV